MKLKRLELKNFGSHKHTIIDFEGERLNESPIVVITGNTGAGKSTLLDGISFALYQQVFRYQFRETSNIKHHNVQDEETQSCITIESRGSEYTIKRTIGSKGGYSLEIIESKFKHSERKEELDRKIIEEIIGCDYSLFSRTIVLPQGQFAALLKTDKPEERRALIQKIFPEVEIYKLIKEKIDQKLRDIDMKIKSIENDINSKSEEFLSGISDISLLLSSLSPTLSKLTPKSPVSEIEKVEEKIIEELKNQLGTLTKEKNDLNEEKTNKTKLKTELETKLKQIQEITKIKQDTQNLEKQIINNLSAFDINIPQINENNLNYIKNEISSLKSRISSELEKIKKLKEEYQLSKNEFENLKKSYTNIKNQIQEKSKKVIQKSLENREEIRREIENLDKELNEINKELEAITTKNLEEQEKELILIVEKLKQKQQLLEDLNSNQKEISKLESEIKIILEELEKKEKQIKEMSEYEIEIHLSKIREKLKEGDQCPVCGGTFSPKNLHLQETHIKNKLTPEELKKIIEEIEKLEKEKRTLISKNGELQGKIENLRTDILSKQKKIEEIEKDLEEKIKRIGITSVSEVENEKQKIQNLKKKLEELNIKKNEIENKKVSLQTIYDMADDFAKKVLKPTQEKLQEYTQKLENNDIFKKLFPNLSPTQLSDYFENYIGEEIEKHLKDVDNKKSKLDNLEQSVFIFETKQEQLSSFKTTPQEDENKIKSEIFKIENELKEIENKIYQKEKEIGDINKKIGEINAEFKKLKNLSSDILNKEKDLEKIKEENSIIKILDEKFDTQKIVNFIIKLKMYEIAETTNTYLSMLGIEDKKLFINLEENNLNFNIQYSDTTITKPVNSLSGGESFLFSVALAFAIAKDVVDSLRINSLFIDEGFDTLDENYNSRVLNFLESFAREKNLTIYIITHKQEIFENTNFPKIEVFKEDGISKVRIVSKKLFI